MLINVLWTGGLDSTFRLVELSREDVEVQPYYIEDSGRKSIPQEKKAMDRIYTILKKKIQTKALLKEIKFIKLEDIRLNDQITKSWEYFSQYNKLGNQYDFLARFALQNNLILEVGLENSTRSKAFTVLKEFGNLQEEKYESHGCQWNKVYKISDNCKLKECGEVFQRLRFPKHLFSIDKLEEIELLKQWGCGDLIHHTWFCHNPIFGFPCGRCNPCKDALNEGLAWRVPMMGRILGSIRYYGVWPLRKILTLIKN